MNFSEFNKQMDSLRKVYGVHKYHEERCSVMFEYLGALPIEAFQKQVSKFIASSEKPPLLSDFEMAFSSQMADLKKESIAKKMAGVSDCHTCNNTGHVTMYDKKNGCEYAFQCTCPRGAIMQPIFSKQFSAMGDIYSSHRAWAAGRFDRLSAQKGTNTVSKDRGV